MRKALWRALVAAVGANLFEECKAKAYRDHSRRRIG